jgi:hypothetical protein
MRFRLLKVRLPFNEQLQARLGWEFAVEILGGCETIR